VISGSPYCDLDRGRWRSILARAAVFRAARAKLAEFTDEIDAGGPALQVLLALEEEAQELLDAGDDVDDHQLVDLMVAAWDARLAARLENKLGDRQRQLLAEIRALLSTACATDPFEEIFRRVTKMASAIYREHWRSASLRLALLGQPPRGGTDPYRITAATAWADGDGSASVELGVHDEGFRPADFAALPMLIIHECVSHVPARQDGKVANDSSFAEGLLDWVAHDLHEQWAGRLDSVLAPAARMHADRLCFFLGQARSEEGDARRRGRRAAEHLRSWFEQHDLAQQHFDGQERSSELATMNVVRLATQLNVVDRPPSVKDNFVSLLGWPFPPPVEKALEAWLADEITAEALLDVEGATV
jgi:hypothetical protein